LYGNTATKSSAKIVCSDFGSSFATSDTVRFIFEIENGSVTDAAETVYIPVSIYSYDSDTH
jgi:hypothetical protein